MTRRPALFEKWIVNRDAAELAAVLQILAAQQPTLRIGGRRNDQRVMEGKGVKARQQDRSTTCDREHPGRHSMRTWLI